MTTVSEKPTQRINVADPRVRCGSFLGLPFQSCKCHMTNQAH